MTDLCTLAVKYGTDKYPWYTPFYDELFDRDAVETVLEIGIGTTQCMGHVPDYRPGASLRMWEEYFPNAVIVGMDIDPTVMVNEGRITSVVCDQSDPAQLASVTKGLSFDFIIDDGSHDPEHQLTTLLTLWSCLKSGGWYIIEDVNFPDELSALIPYPNNIGYLMADGSHAVGRLIYLHKD